MTESSCSRFEPHGDDDAIPAGTPDAVNQHHPLIEGLCSQAMQLFAEL